MSGGYSSREPALETETLTLYVLECEDDCWYVGKTGDMNECWNDHNAPNGGSAWTRLHRPIRIHSETEVPAERAELDVRKTTARLMLQHGINKVRGGPLNYKRSYESTKENDIQRVAGSIRKALNLDYDETKQKVIKMLEEEEDDAEEDGEANGLASLGRNLFKCW